MKAMVDTARSDDNYLTRARENQWYDYEAKNTTRNYGGSAQAIARDLRSR